MAGSENQANVIEVMAGSVPRLALSPKNAAIAADTSEWQIFSEIRHKRLTARKSGRSTLIEVAELARWVRSLPTKGRSPDAETIAA